MHPRLEFLTNPTSSYAEELLLPMFEAFSEWENFNNVKGQFHGTHTVSYIENDLRKLSSLVVRVGILSSHIEHRTVGLYILHHKIEISNYSRTILYNLDALNYLEGNLALRYPKFAKV